MDNNKNLYELTNPNADLEFEQNVMNNPKAFNQYKNNLNTYIDNEVQRINNGYVHRQDYRYDFIFNNPNVHSIVYNGIQYWLAKDIARELGYIDANDMVKRNVKPGDSITLSSKEVATNLVATSFESLGLNKYTPKAAFTNFLFLSKNPYLYDISYSVFLSNIRIRTIYVSIRIFSKIKK